MSSFYLIWVPLTILYYSVFTWLSYLNNTNSKWLIPLFIYGALCPMWVLVSRFSKNIIFDGVVYDALMVITYVCIMGLLGAGKEFTIANWAGISMMVMGCILVKV